MSRAGSKPGFSRPELAECFPGLLEIGSREVVDFVLLQEGVHLHSRFETQQPAKLSRRERLGPVCFKCQAFQCRTRQVLPLGSEWKDLPRAALESLAFKAYRSQALTAAQLRRLLGFETRMQVDAFLKEHEVYDFTAADFEQARETLRQLRAREARL